MRRHYTDSTQMTVFKFNPFKNEYYAKKYR